MDVEQIKSKEKGKFLPTDFSMFTIGHFVIAFLMWFVILNGIQLIGILYFKNISFGIISSVSVIFSEFGTMFWLAKITHKKTGIETSEIINNSIAGFFKNLTNSKTVKAILGSILVIILLNTATNTTMLVIQKLFNLNDVVNQNQEVIAVVLKQSSVLTVISVVFIAPVFEEILFRGLFQTTLSKFLMRVTNLSEKKAYWISVIVVSFAFSFNHNYSINPFLLAPYFVMGLYFQHLVRKYNSIYASIYTHMCMNAIGILGMFLMLLK